MYLMYVVLFKLLNGMHAQSCPTLCNPCRASLPVEFSQARILEWVAISSSRGSSQPRDQPTSARPSWAGGFFTTGATGEAKFLNNPVLFCETTNLMLLMRKLRPRKLKLLSKITLLVNAVSGTQTAYSLLSGP